MHVWMHLHVYVIGSSIVALVAPSNLVVYSVHALFELFVYAEYIWAFVTPESPIMSTFVGQFA